MEYQSIADIYEANVKIRGKLLETLASVNERQAEARPGGEEWSISQIVEHVSIVAGGMYRICAKLLLKAEKSNQLSDGNIDLGEFFKKANGIAEVKLEAPEFVRPKGDRPIAESVKVLEENQKSFRELQPLFEKYDANSNKYPHPFLGDLSALEWLALAGGHEARHLKQIKKIIEKLDKTAG